MVGASAFCVPPQFLVREVPHAASHLPDDGLAFHFPPRLLDGFTPQRNFRGEVMDVYGHVIVPPGLLLNRKEAARLSAMSGLQPERQSGDLVFGYETKDRYHWVAWRLAGAAAPTIDALREQGEPLATCHVPARERDKAKAGAGTCRRLFHHAGLRFGYALDPANLARVQEWDSLIANIVMGWRCAR